MTIFYFTNTLETHSPSPILYQPLFSSNTTTSAPFDNFFMALSFIDGLSRTLTLFDVIFPFNKIVLAPINKGSVRTGSTKNCPGRLYPQDALPPPSACN